jgi:beta-1,4-mannosyl-glycoprotein beta-1,4-N-acetylglucosaminyltransferase
MISDVDEIPNPEKIKENRLQENVFVFQQRMYYYYLNCLEVEPFDHAMCKWWYGTVMTPYHDFPGGNRLRMMREVSKFRKTRVLEDAGWHFSYLGGTDRIIQKLESFAHAEFNKNDYKDPQKIKQLIESGKGIFGQEMQCVFKDIDESFPVYVQNNRSKLKNYIFEQPSS